MAKRKKKSEEQIRRSMIAQLKAKGANVAHFENLVDLYIYYLSKTRAMQEDIETKGLTYTATSAAGKEYEKDNPSAKLMPVYTREMLRIMKDLGLTTDEPTTEEDDEL